MPYSSSLNPSVLAAKPVYWRSLFQQMGETSAKTK